MPSKKSGGKRAVEKKHDEREARRRRHGFSEAAWRKRYEDAGPVPSDPEQAFAWAGRIACIAMAEAAADPGPPPEQRREQIGRIAAQLVKVLEPAKLSAKLADYEQALEELSADAAPVGTREDGAPRPSSSLS